MSEFHEVTELERSKRRLLDAGGSLQHKKIKDELSKADSKALAESERLSSPKYAFVSDWIGRGVSGIALLFFSLVMVVGLFVALFAIPAAEYAAVYEGLYSIKPDANIATLTTLALFLGLLVLMFLKHVFEDNLNGERPHNGIRYGVARLLIYLGAEHNNTLNRVFRLDKLRQRTKNELNYLRIASTLFIAEVVIVSASALARLSTVLLEYGSNPAAEALNLIRSNITATEVITTVLTMLLVVGLIKMLDMFVLFVYVSFVNSAGRLDLGNSVAVDSETLYAELRDRYQSEVLNDLSLTLEHRNRNEQS